MPLRRRTAHSTVLALGVLIVAVLGIVSLEASAADRAPDKRTCGVLPGDGAYSYVKARNVSCRVARKVGRKAGRKFCSGDRCPILPTDEPVEGTARPNGWECEMKVGYEFFQARCRKGDMRFLQEAAA